MTTKPTIKYLVILTAIIYFAMMAAINSRIIFHHPDERHYSYGGTRMVETGNWLIPYNEEGEIRLKKPIIPYWMSAVGFKLFGIHVLSARLLWIIASSLLLIVTYALARALGASPQAALVGELFLAGNPGFLQCSMIANPDIPLALFMTLSTLALVRLMNNKSTKGDVWMFWLGIALAILSKGLLPIIFAVFIIVFLLFSNRKKLIKLLSPFPILTSFLLILAWYAFVIYNYPDLFLNQFFGDQVTEKVELTPLKIISHFVILSLIVGLSFLDLIWILLPYLLRKKMKSLWRVQAWSPAVKLLLLWSVLVIFIFSFGNKALFRYLLPIVPLFSALLALTLTHVIIALKWPSSFKRTAMIFAGIGFVITLLGAMIIAQVYSNLLGLTFVAGGGFLWIGIGIISKKRLSAAIYLVGPTHVLILIFVLFPILAPLILPHPAIELAKRLKKETTTSKTAAFTGNFHIPSAIQLYVGSTQRFQMLFPPFNDETLKQFSVVMATEESTAKTLSRLDFSVEKIPVSLQTNKQDVTTMLKAIFTWHLKEVLAEHRNAVFFAKRQAYHPERSEG